MCSPNTYGPNKGKVDKGDIAFAAFVTIFVGMFLLFVAFMLLCAIIASKGIVLFVLLIVGAVCYGIWKAIDATVNGEKDA